MSKLGRKPWVQLQVVGCGFALGLAALVAATTDATVGADVTVIYLTSPMNHGASGGVRGYSIGTTSCNVGDKPLWWCDEGDCDGAESNEHPVIAQNLYRLANGRFEQIGMSWLKHGFLSLNTFDPLCGSCQPPPEGPDQLGVGCTDAYSANLNGSRPLGLRSEVDPTTGQYPFPYTEVSASAVYDQRVKVLESELDPALNPGARYWIEGQYIAPDDAAAGNGHNNASHREVTVAAGSFNLSLAAPTVREQPAIFAWKAVDPSVELVAVDVPGTMERFHVARKVTEDAGTWHYEYTVHNLNSATAAGAFAVVFPRATTFTNVGFRDVDHHSGEPYETTDWDFAVDEPTGSVRWLTDPFAVDPDANALRWATMFSFWFDASSPPDGAAHALELFATPTVVPFAFAAGPIFGDGFESGDTSTWSLRIGG